MHTLVTASTGFTAIPLARLLIEQGHLVKALIPKRGREENAAVVDLQQSGLELVSGNPTDPASLEKATRGVDVVFHLDWQATLIGGPRGRKHLDGLQRLIDACKKWQVARLVFSSTTAVYDSGTASASTPLRENDRLGEISAAKGPFWGNYAKQMHSAEKLILDRLPQPDYVIVRHPFIYGAHTQFASQLVQRALSSGNPEQSAEVSQWLHVEDLVRALMLAAETPEAANETLIVAGSEAVRETDLMAFIERRARHFIQSGNFPYADKGELPLVGANLDICKARRILHFTPSVPLSEGIDDMLIDVLEKNPPAYPGVAGEDPQRPVSNQPIDQDAGARSSTPGGQTQTQLPRSSAWDPQHQSGRTLSWGPGNQPVFPFLSRPQTQRHDDSKIAQQGAFNPPFQQGMQRPPGRLSQWGRVRPQTQPSFSWEPQSESGDFGATGPRAPGLGSNRQNMQRPLGARFRRIGAFGQPANLNRTTTGVTSNDTIDRHAEAEAQFDPDNDMYRGWLAWKGFSELFGEDDAGYWNFGLWNEETHSRRQACDNLTETLLSYVSDKSGNILDIGCGVGTLSQRLTNHYPPAKINGIDIDEEQIRICREKLQEVDFQVMDAANMDYVGETYDNLICVETALHINSRGKFLQEAFRVLKPGGRLLFSDLMMPAHTYAQPKENEAVSSYEAYRRLCLDSGFNEVFILETTESWGRCASYLENLLHGKAESGELPWPRYSAIIRSLRHTIPNVYIFGWCKKAK